MARRICQLALHLVVLSVLGGCDSSPPPANPFDPAPDAPKPLPAMSEVPKPSGPPEVVIDELSPRVGFSRVLQQKDEDRAKLTKEFEQNAEHFRGKTVTVIAERKAKTEWVAAVIDDLGRVGADAVEVATESRGEFKQKLVFTPQQKAASAPKCSLVGMVRADRGTAVWRLNGGVAAKRSKGFAGPDLSMTGETIERMAKGCKDSSVFFVTGDPAVEWGLVYDLAASVYVLEKAKFDTNVLLREVPIAGRPVAL